MKRLLFLSLLAAVCTAAPAQQRTYPTYWHQRATLFASLPVTKSDIIFLGNSITDGCEWGELFQNPHVKNRGISGDVCLGVYDRLDAITKGQPAKIFLLIGINDVARGVPADTIAARTRLIVETIRRQSPRTKVYVQSVLPVTDHYGMFSGHTSRGEVVRQINAQLPKIAADCGATFIDLYSHFVDPATGKLREDLTNDGLHMLGAGYQLWKSVVQKYI